MCAQPTSASVTLLPVPWFPKEGRPEKIEAVARLVLAVLQKLRLVILGFINSSLPLEQFRLT